MGGPPLGKFLIDIFKKWLKIDLLILGYAHPVPSSFIPQDLGAFHNESRRIRTTFTPSQLRALEKRFKTNHYIVGDERKQLAQELSLNESQVYIIFYSDHLYRGHAWGI